jgi:hypothetical protein
MTTAMRAAVTMRGQQPSQERRTSLQDSTQQISRIGLETEANKQAVLSLVD